MSPWQVKGGKKGEYRRANIKQQQHHEDDYKLNEARAKVVFQVFLEKLLQNMDLHMNQIGHEYYEISVILHKQ